MAQEKKDNSLEERKVKALENIANTLEDLNDWSVNLNFLALDTDEPKKIDNTKGGKICPNCGVSL